MIAPNKSNCTGCAACYSICPVQCISMKHNDEGFLFPNVDEKKCIGCNKCKKSCPAIVQGDARKPLNVYAVKNPDEEIRFQSSSGGIFTLLAENTIKEGGIVFGARFNEKWEVIHDYSETAEGLAAFRGSKYVQSATGNIYKQVKDFLENGRKVLFSGVPCQIAGLKAFLKKDFDTLLTIDLICHGVANPYVWKKYLDEFLSNNKTKLSQVVGVKFRDKRCGWRQYSFSIFTVSGAKKNIFTESKVKNIYRNGFVQNIFLRMSCYNCPTRSLRSGSDITIGDFWGIENILPDFADDKGVNLVLVNTEKGKLFYNTLEKIDRELTYADAIQSSCWIEESAPLEKKRTIFFDKWRHEPIIPLIAKLAAVPLRLRIKNKISVLLHKVRLLAVIKYFIERESA